MNEAKINLIRKHRTFGRVYGQIQWSCMDVSQEASKVFCYSHLFKNFPQFVVIHTVKGFGIVNKAEIDVFLELSCFFDVGSGES